MIRVFVIVPTPLMQAGLQTLLTGIDMQVIGSSSIPADAISELPVCDVIVVDETLLEDLSHTMANLATIGLVVLSNNLNDSLPLLRSLSLRGWGVVPLNASSAQLQAAVSAVAEGFVVLPLSSISAHKTNRSPPVSAKC